MSLAHGDCKGIQTPQTEYRLGICLCLFNGAESAETFPNVTSRLAARQSLYCSKG